MLKPLSVVQTCSEIQDTVSKFSLILLYFGPAVRYRSSWLLAVGQHCLQLVHCSVHLCCIDPCLISSSSIVY